MPRTPEVAATYARLVLQSGVISPARLLRGVDLTEQMAASQEYVPATELAVLFANYNRYVKDPTWTAKMGAQLNIAAHGPLGFAALSAPTLGEALDVMGNLLAVRSTTMTARSFATPTHYLLEFEDSFGAYQFYCWMIEIVMKIVEALLASILGHPVGKNVVIRLAQPEPAHARELAESYDSTLKFDQEVNSIEVPLAWRQLPSPLHDEAAYRANLIKCRETIAAREQSGSLALAVHNRLSNHFDSQSMVDSTPTPPPTLEQMAQSLHMTSRTLIRRLQREETSFKEMLESLRREHSARLLQNAGLTASEVGLILGYGEAANFGRAFRRWYGQSPSAWRRSNNKLVEPMGGS
jgi:AraC-like DNA-binding protein